GAQGPLGEWDPGAAGVGEAHAVGRAEEEGGAEVALERLQAGGQGGLGYEEGLGCPADAAAAGHLEEALDLHELDAVGSAEIVYGHGPTLQILSMGVAAVGSLGHGATRRLCRRTPRRAGR